MPLLLEDTASEVLWGVFNGAILDIFLVYPLLITPPREKLTPPLLDGGYDHSTLSLL
jgi:hypothetical protein